MKLRSKMSWMIALSVALSIVLLIVLIYVITIFFAPGYNHVKLQQLSVELADRLEQAGSTNGPSNQVLRDFAVQYEGIAIDLYDREGELLFTSISYSEPYSKAELLQRFVDQPGRMFNGEDVSLVYHITVADNGYFVVFHVEGHTLQRVQVFLYFNDLAAWPFLFVPLFLIIFLPTMFAFLFLLFHSRRLRRLNDAMQRVDLQQEPVYVQDKSGDEIGALARLFNEMSDKLHQQYIHIRQVEHARALLIGSLSHDLRTPLSIIQGYAETLQRGSAQEPDTRIKHATIIVQKTEYLNRLLGQLLRLAELDDSSSAVRMDRVSIHSLLQTIVAEYVLLLNDRGFEWAVDITEPHAYVNCDAEVMAQVFRNLIDNAIHHGGSGKYLSIKVRTLSDSVQVHIEDRGKGIEEKELTRIFERFYRGDKGRQSNGIGIGLSLANETVIRHGGSITVRSTPLTSTVFTVVLPLAGTA